MPLSDIVSGTITAQTQTVARAGFNTAMLVAYHTEHLDRSREYSSLTAVSEDHAAGTPIYRAAQAFFSQSPRASKLKIGRRGLPMTQVFRVVPVVTTEGFIYTLQFVEPDGTVRTMTHTVGAAATVATIIDAFKIAIDALAMDVTTTDNTTSLDITAANAGELFDIEDKSTDGRPGSLTVKNTTTDPGIATDLAAIRLADSDWYGLAIDSNSEAEGLATMAWAEANTVLFSTDSSDTEILAAGTTNDYFSDAETSAYARSFGTWKDAALSYCGIANLGRMMPFTPGEFDLHLKTIAGQARDNLSGTQESSIAGKSGNHYTLIAGKNVIRPAKTFASEFIDIVPLLDYLNARIQENVFSALQSLDKPSYSNSTVSMIKGIVESTLQERESTPKKSKGLRAGTILVSAPLVEDVATATRAARILPDVEFDAEADGAIHQVIYSGRIAA